MLHTLCCPQGLPPKKVMLWMANPFPEPSKNQTVQTFIDGLKPHRMAFTSLSYQYHLRSMQMVSLSLCLAVAPSP